jgi:integrase
LKAAGVEAGGVAGAFGCHSFRKCWCRALYDFTHHDLALVRVAMGHQSIETTQQYLSVSDDEVDRAVMALGDTGKEQAAAFPRGFKEVPMA